MAAGRIRDELKALEKESDKALALEAARQYVSKLNLEQQVSYGTPGAANFTRPDKSKPNYQIVHEYKIPVTVLDSDSTEVYFNLYFNPLTNTLRKETHWNPKKESIEAAITGKKQHYVLLVTESEEEAKRILDESYKRDGVVTASYGGKEVLRQIEGQAVFAWAHGAKINAGPKLSKVKPKEKKRKSLVERCQVISEFSKE